MATACPHDPALSYQSPPRPVSPRIRPLVVHSLIVVLLAAGTLCLYRGIYFDGVKSSDGISYAMVARNLSEGRGLTSSVIQPGFINVLPTDRQGQPFILQAPLWPTLL